MRSAMFALEIHSQRAPGGVEGGVIKRGRARDTAYPVGSKKLFGHEKSLSLQTVWPGPVRASFRADNLTNLSTRNRGFTAWLCACPLHNRAKSRIRSLKSLDLLYRSR